MLRAGPRGTAVCSKFGRRFCNNAAGVTNEGLKKPPQRARLWAMERTKSKNKSELAAAMKAWRFPASLHLTIDWLPEGVSSLLYMDRLQVHQFYWKLGDHGFICTPFQLDIYERGWEEDFEKARVLSSVVVYPHLYNKNKDNDIINLVLVSPTNWGKRCLVHYSGEQDCIGLRKGGVLKKVLNYVALDCDVDLPLADIHVDVSNLDIGEKISIQDLNLDLKVKSNLSPKTPVCIVVPAAEVQKDEGCSEIVQPS